MKNILITGAAGFIGFHLSNKLVAEGYNVIGVDNLNDYYDVKLKNDRLSVLAGFENFTFKKLDLIDEVGLKGLFSDFKIDVVVNLAAQAGVRYSIENPKAYINANINGFSNLIEISKNHNVENFIFASSSSVYGANKNMPFSVKDNVDHPMSLYAATKKANELIAHSYSSLFNLPVTGLRFFTVYGPFGRPDMALFLFTKAIIDGKPIKVFNNGEMKRDFTYVDDIVGAIVKLIEKPSKPNKDWSGETPDNSTSYAPYRIYNIGNNAPVKLMEFIESIEKHLGIKAKKDLLPLQPGDVPETYANVESLINDIDYKPETSIDYGVGKFIEWYKNYYKV